MARGPAEAQPAPPASQPAQPDVKPPPGSAYETVVVGRSLPRGASVQEVGQTELEREGVLGAAEALERTPAIHATTGQRGERIFSLRGFDQRQISVLLDGAPFYVTYEGQVDLAMLPALALDHITVVKGPSSILFGPNGLGGAVNLVTRRPGAGPFASLLFEGSPMAALRLAASHSASVGRWSWAVYGGYDWRAHWPLAAGYKPTGLQPAGDRTSSDRQTWNVGADGAVRLGDSHQLRATLLYVDGGRGVPPSTVDPTPRHWRFSVWRAVAVSLAHEMRRSAWDLDEVAYLRLFDNLLDSYDDATYSTQSSPAAFHNWYHDWVIGARGRSQYRRGTRIGTLFVRGWLGFQEDVHRDVPGGSIAPTTYSRTLITAAPEVELDPGPRWRLLASCQFDVDVPGKVETASAETAWSPGPLLSAQYSPWKSTMFRLTAARRTRFPTLKERFSSAIGARQPNPDLQPEGAWHFGLDGSYKLSRYLRADASVYDAEVRNLIQDVMLGGGRDQLQNIASARLLGAELLLGSRPLRMLELQAGYSFLYARRTDGGPKDQIAYRPAHRALASFVLTPWRWLEVSALLRVIGSQDYQDPLTRVWGVLGPYALLDARVEVRPLPWLAVWARGTNLIGTYYQSEVGFPDPGRVIWMGLKLSRE